MSIDNNIIAKFTGPLQRILEGELQAGNKITETYEAIDGQPFPVPHAVMIFLEKPFKTKIQTDLPGIEFREVNDPHYWKAEYFDRKRAQFLCCKFD